MSKTEKTNLVDLTSTPKPLGALASSVSGQLYRSKSEEKVKKGKGTRDLAGKKQKRNMKCCCGSGKKAKDCCVFFPQGMGGID